MPKVEITRSRQGLPGTSGRQSTGTVQTASTIGEAVAGAGQAVLGFSEERIEEARLAEDSSYVANMGVEAERLMADIQEAKRAEYAENPKGFSDAVVMESQKRLQTLLDNAPSSRAKRSLESQFSGMTRSLINQTRAYERKAFVDTLAAKHNQSVNILDNQVADGIMDYDTALRHERELTDSAETYASNLEGGKKALSLGTRKRLASTYVKSLAKEDLAAAKDFLERSDVENMYSSDEILKLTATAEAIHEDVLDQKEDLAKEANEKVQNEIRFAAMTAKSIADLDGARTIFETAVEDGVIEEGSKVWAGMYKLLEDTAEDVGETKANVDRVNESLQGNVKLSPQIDEDVDAVDHYYDTVMKRRMETMDEDAQVSYMVDTAARIGIIPSKLVTDINRGVLSGKPADRAKWAKVTTSLVQHDAYLGEQLDSSVEQAFIISDLVESGTPAEDAVNIADTYLGDGDPKREARKKGFESYIPSKADERRKKLLKGFSVDDDIVTEAQLNSIEATAASMYIQSPGASFETALEAAQVRVLGNMVKSKAGQSHRMSNTSPEAYFKQNNLDPDRAIWLLEKDLGLSGKEGVLSKQLSTMEPVLGKQRAKRIKETMTPIRVPASTVSGEPKYHIQWINEKGDIEYLKAVEQVELDGKKVPVETMYTWTPDLNKVPERQAEANLKKQLMIEFARQKATGEDPFSAVYANGPLKGMKKGLFPQMQIETAKQVLDKDVVDGLGRVYAQATPEERQKLNDYANALKKARPLVKKGSDIYSILRKELDQGFNDYAEIVRKYNYGQSAE